jgi:predicted ATPase
MLARLDHSLSLLTGGARDLPVRHQTLRGAIDWSYDLLTTEEQRLFAQVSVFRGGFNLVALEAVANGSTGSNNYDEQEPGEDLRQASASTVQVLRQLIDRSLVQQREGVGGASRFYMLETIRDHAMERLEQSGRGDDLRRQHATYYLHLVEGGGPESAGDDPESWLSHIENTTTSAVLSIGRFRRRSMGWPLASQGPCFASGTCAATGVRVGSGWSLCWLIARLYP